jgi:hypothetical protein
MSVEVIAAPGVIDTVTLKKLKLSLSQMITEEFVRDAEVCVITAHLERLVELRLRGFLWAQQIEQFSYRQPEDWWQAVKERWMPAWALSHWPVKYTRHTVDVKAVYTKLNLCRLNEDAVVIATAGMVYGEIKC